MFMLCNNIVSFIKLDKNITKKQVSNIKIAIRYNQKHLGENF